METPACDALVQYLEKHNDKENAEFMNLFLAAVCEGSIKTVRVEGNLYEVYGELLESA